MIRNCDGYNVYYLRPTPAYSAYCFGNVYDSNGGRKHNVSVYNLLVIVKSLSEVTLKQ